MPNPFNFTISDMSPIFQYSPSRDGPIDSSWNVSFSGSPDSTWVMWTLGVGTSAHRTTFPGASARLDWLGTAIYLYGDASVGACTIELDGATTKVETNTPGLLFAKSGLTYNSHSLTLRVVQGTSTTSISSAIIRDGIVLTGTWYQHDFYLGSGTVPRIATDAIGSTISFPISSASAFYIVGHVNLLHGPYLVTLTPPLDLGSVQTFEYNGNSRWGHINMLTFLATGLDRTRTYHVQLTNKANSHYDQSQIVIIDAPPASSQPPSSGSNSQQSLSAGSIAAIVIGLFLFLIILIFLFLLWRRRRSLKMDGVMTQHDSLSASATVPSPSIPPISRALLSSWPVVQERALNPEHPTTELRPLRPDSTISQSEQSIPQLPAPTSLPISNSPPYPIPSGLTQEDARFFNNLYALNVPAAEIATMMEALRAERDPVANDANMTMEGFSSSGPIRAEPEIVPPRYDFKDPR